MSGNWSDCAGGVPYDVREFTGQPTFTIIAARTAAVGRVLPGAPHNVMAAMRVVPPPTEVSPSDCTVPKTAYNQSHKVRKPSE